MRMAITLCCVFGMSGCLVYDESAGPSGPEAEGAYSGECHNGEDDDGDDLVDCRDDDCAEASNCADHEVTDDTGEDTGSDAQAAEERAQLRDEEHDPLATTAQLGAGALLILLAGRSARRGSAER